MMKKKYVYVFSLLAISNLTAHASGPAVEIEKPMLVLNEITTSEIAQKVRSIIADKLGVDEREITDDASFTNDLGADSLDLVELIMEFEKEFNISIPDDEAENIGTVGEAIEYIKKNAPY